MDVPAHIQNPPAIINQVHVQGGRGIDLSRATPPTPLLLAPTPPPRTPAYAGPYQPGDGVPLRQPDAVVEYEPGQLAVDRAVLTRLVDSFKGQPVHLVVAGHADGAERAAAAIAHRRAMEVAGALRRAGLAVRHYSFGTQRPAPGSDNARRVDIFAIEQPRASYRVLE